MLTKRFVRQAQQFWQKKVKPAWLLNAVLLPFLISLLAGLLVKWIK